MVNKPFRLQAVHRRVSAIGSIISKAWCARPYATGAQECEPENPKPVKPRTCLYI